ncbi:MAG: trypsin-like serine protease [Sandaracinaceae bacterium]
MRSTKLLLPFLCLAACAAPGGSFDPTEGDSAGLIAGRYTFERPEVGSIRTGGSCTATLFGSAQTVITAAHCVDYLSRGPGFHGEFTLEPAPGQRFTYAIQQIVVFGSRADPSADDVALLQLSEPVPASIAQPARPAAVMPAFGTPVTIYGYGCQERIVRTTFAKQALNFAWGNDTFNLCPGDSGGPTMTSDGEVLRVNSAFITTTGRDLFGEVNRHLDRLLAYVDAWRGTNPRVWIDGAAPSPPAPVEPPVEPTPPAPPAPGPGSVDARCAAHVDCGSCVADSYCGFCDAGCVALHIDGAGQLQGNGCGTPAVFSEWSCPAPDAPAPPPAPEPSEPPPSAGVCGDYADALFFTCTAEGTGFVQCTETGLMDAPCPAGSVCTPGSTVLACSL